MFGPGIPFLGWVMFVYVKDILNFSLAASVFTVFLALDEGKAHFDFNLGWAGVGVVFMGVG